MEYVTSFLIGGLICAAVQILMDRTKLMPGRIMVLLVCSGAVLGFCGVYEPFQEFAGSGAGVPLLGFGNTLWQGVRVQGKRGRHIGGAHLRISGVHYLRTQDEEVADDEVKNL